MAFASCSYVAATYQPKLKDCNGADLPAGTEMATCADLAGLSIADATDTTKGKVALNAGTSLPGDATNCTDALTACGLNALLTDPAAGGNTVINNIKALAPSAPDATDTVKGIAALNSGTSLPGDATNCTDALTACGLNALLADATVGGNAVINGVKALIPLATTTVAGLIEEATGEETRLGATDANRADRAVTPESMSYALQTGKDYIINLNSSKQYPFTFFGQNFATVNSGDFSSPGNATVLTLGLTTNVSGGVYAATYSACNQQMTSTGGTLVGVIGNSAAVGTGRNIGVYGSAVSGGTNFAGYFDGTVVAGTYTTLSDATLKENAEAIDPAKALQFRNGLSWKKYEMFTEQQVQINDAEGNATGRYEVKRNSLGIKRGLIAQEVLALAQSIGDFSDVVVEVGEYFTLDAQGYPVKDAQGNNIVNKRLGIDYDAVSFIVMCAEQSLLIPA